MDNKINFGELSMLKSITQKASLNTDLDNRIDIALEILSRSEFKCEKFDLETIVVNGKKCQIVFDLASYKPDKRKKFEATIFFKTQYTGEDAFTAHVKIQLWYNWTQKIKNILESPKSLIDFLKS